MMSTHTKATFTSIWTKVDLGVYDDYGIPSEADRYLTLFEEDDMEGFLTPKDSLLYSETLVKANAVSLDVINTLAWFLMNELHFGEYNV